jgi:uncharacterized protein YcbX
MRVVGRIAQLARYPVKSMTGEQLATSKLTLQGLPEDRRYAFVQRSSRSAFPWLTARECPDLLRYRPTVGGESPEGAVVTVTTPDGENVPVTSDKLRQELESCSGRDLFLMHDGRGSYDVAPVSLITRQTIAQVANESGTSAEPRRFRPNLFVELDGGSAFDELDWVGSVLRVGNTARLAVTEADQRCMMITLDPDTAKSNPAVLRSVVQQHRQCAGVYATVVTAGSVKVGDVIALEA